jgi:hypothetical protein
MNHCYACGQKVKKFVYRKIASEKLVSDWKLSDKERLKQDRKESLFCPNCGCSARSRAMARAILKTHPDGSNSLKTWVKKQKGDFRVAEINYTGHLHQFLVDLPSLTLSQYSEETVRAKFFNWLKGIKKEDITNLTYPDSSFDLVLHSEVIEHVPDPVKALKECKRILKPGGVCLFTYPEIPGRETISRKGLPDSYHGSGESGNLVYWEFGSDFAKKQKLKAVIKEPDKHLWVYALVK